MNLSFLDWSLPPTLVFWKRHLASLKDSSSLTTLWHTPPAQFLDGKPTTDTDRWLHFLLEYGTAIDHDFLSSVIAGFTAAEWRLLRTNSSALTEDAWSLIKHHTLERCTQHHLPKATVELDLIDWLIENVQLSGAEPEVSALLDILLDPETDGTPGLLAIPCYPLLQRLATLPNLPSVLVSRLSSVAEHLAAPRGHKKPPLLEPTTDLRVGLLTHPACTEDIVLSLMQHSHDPAVFLAIALTPRWAKERTIQQSILMLDRIPVEDLKPIVVAITHVASPEDLVVLFRDIELALRMQGKDPLPLLRLFVKTLSPDQIKSLSKETLVWFLQNPDREIRASTAALFQHRSPPKPKKSDPAQEDFLSFLLH